MTVTRCVGRIWFQHVHRECGNKASVERDGKWYCLIHDPVRRDAKRKLSHDRWKADYDQQQANIEERSKREEAASMLIRMVLDYPANTPGRNTWPILVELARKAKGE